jgi:hypothetical protein
VRTHELLHAIGLVRICSARRRELPRTQMTPLRRPQQPELLGRGSTGSVPPWTKDERDLDLLVCIDVADTSGARQRFPFASRQRYAIHGESLSRLVPRVNALPAGAGTSRFAREQREETEMSKAISDYMAHLAGSEEARQKHREDPDAAMSEHNLSDDERELVKSGDHDQIRARVRESDPGLADTMAIIL